jgi:hypothetical protein
LICSSLFLAASADCHLCLGCRARLK